MTVKFEMNAQDSKRVKRLFTHLKKESKPALRRAINQAVKGSMTDFNKAARNRLHIKLRDVKSVLSKETARGNNLQGWVEADKKPIPLSKFRWKITRSGVSVKAWKNKKPVVVEGGFVANVPAGLFNSHKGIFRRETYWRYHKASGARRILFYGQLPRRYRLPIGQFFGPTVYHAIKDKPTLSKLQADGIDRFEKRLTHEIKRLTESNR